MFFFSRDIRFFPFGLKRGHKNIMSIAINAMAMLPCYLSPKAAAFYSPSLSMVMNCVPKRPKIVTIMQIIQIANLS